MARAWYAVHTYSGHENKVKTNIERRAESLHHAVDQRQPRRAAFVPFVVSAGKLEGNLLD